MVTNVTSLTGNGLKDWLIQRVTAIYLAVYFVFLATFLARHPGMNYETWLTLFSSVWVQIGTVLAVLVMSLHAWIGIWTVSTDYIKCTMIRLSVQMLVALWLAGQFIWGLMIVWGR